MEKYIARLVNLIPEDRQHLFDLTPDEARQRLISGDPDGVRSIAGSFALVARQDDEVFLARSLDRPLRYFLAKEVEGPMLSIDAEGNVATSRRPGGSTLDLEVELLASEPALRDLLRPYGVRTDESGNARMRLTGPLSRPQVQFQPAR